MNDKMFPIIPDGKSKPHPLQIPWSVAEQAYTVYLAKYGSRQSLETLAQRGGFHVSEMDMLLLNWREQSSEITQLRTRIEQLHEELDIATRERNEAIQASMNDMGAKQRAEARWNLARSRKFGLACWTEFAKPMIRYEKHADAAVDAVQGDPKEAPPKQDLALEMLERISGLVPKEPGESAEEAVQRMVLHLDLATETLKRFFLHDSPFPEVGTREGMQEFINEMTTEEIGKWGKAHPHHLCAALLLRAFNAEERLKQYRTNAKLLSVGFENEAPVFWVHDQPGMFHDALSALDASVKDVTK
jgi:hypothetical protein